MSLPEPEHSEKYYFEAVFVIAETLPIELYEYKEFVTVPSLLRVRQAVAAKIRERYPKATGIELRLVERVNERWYARQTARKLTDAERAAILVAHRKGYCLRTRSGSDTGANYRVCRRLSQLGLFRAFMIDNSPAYTLNIAGIPVAEYLESVEGRVS